MKSITLLSSILFLIQLQGLPCFTASAGDVFGDGDFEGFQSISNNEGLGQNETFVTCNVPDEWLMDTGIGTTSFGQGTKWPNGVVKYELHSSLSAADRTEVQKAFDEYHRKTCIRFVQRSPGEAAYTSIERDEAVCGLGHICRTGEYQFAKFGGGCRNADVMIHELGHNLCMGHEQQRSDRDTFLHFPGCSGNDVPGKNTNYNNLNSMYDFASRMHYQCNWCPGGWPRNSNIKKCGHSAGLSVLDANKINDFYNCGGCLSYRFRNFQLLSSGDRSALFPAGNDPNPNAGTTYVCRSYHSNGDRIPGVFALSTQTCYIANGGVETGVRAGDVLTNPQGARLTWVRGGGIPSNAIAGGRTMDGEALYIARATIEVNGQRPTIPGKIHASSPGFAYVAYGGREYKVTDFSILVCS